MLRSLVVVVMVTIAAASAFAQQAAMARTIRTAVVVSQPRGDSPVVATLQPGMVIEVLGRSGDWYQTPVGSQLGWVNRVTIEMLSTGGNLNAASAPGALLPEVITPAAQGATAGAAQTLSIEEPYLTPGTTELMLTGSISGISVDGNTESVAEASALLGFVISPALELLISAEIAKISGIDAVGSFGGGLLTNFRDDRRVIPFAGGLIARSVGASDLVGGLVDDSTFVSVFGGFRVMTRGGGGAFIVRPFYERYFTQSEFLEIPSRDGRTYPGAVLPYPAQNRICVRLVEDDEQLPLELLKDLRADVLIKIVRYFFDVDAPNVTEGERRDWPRWARRLDRRHNIGCVGRRLHRP